MFEKRRRWTGWMLALTMMLSLASQGVLAGELTPPAVHEEETGSGASAAVESVGTGAETGISSSQENDPGNSGGENAQPESDASKNSTGENAQPESDASKNSTGEKLSRNPTHRRTAPVETRSRERTHRKMRRKTHRQETMHRKKVHRKMFSRERTHQ